MSAVADPGHKTYRPTSAKVRKNVKHAILLKGDPKKGIKVRDVLTSTVEDAVSQNLLVSCESIVRDGLFDLHAQLQSSENKATLYSHGGLAIMNYIRGMGLKMEKGQWMRMFSQLTDGSPRVASVNQHFLTRAYELLYAETPRDWDLCVLQEVAPICRSLSACMKSPLFQTIFGHVHAMRTKVHNHLASKADDQSISDMQSRGVQPIGTDRQYRNIDDVLDRALTEAKMQLAGYEVISIRPLDSNHISIEPHITNNDDKVLRIRGNKRTDRSKCDMHVKEENAPVDPSHCFPIRDSFNTDISFGVQLGGDSGKSMWPAAFTLIRLAIMVEVEYKIKKQRGAPSPGSNETLKKRFGINFLDLSVPRIGDAVYMDGGRNTVDAQLPAVKVVRRATTPDAPPPCSPFSSLSYIYETTSRQLQDFANKVLDGLANLGKLPADSPYMALKDNLEQFLLEEPGLVIIHPSIVKEFKAAIKKDVDLEEAKNKALKSPVEPATRFTQIQSNVNKMEKLCQRVFGISVLLLTTEKDRLMDEDQKLATKEQLRAQYDEHRNRTAQMVSRTGKSVSKIEQHTIDTYAVMSTVADMVSEFIKKPQYNTVANKATSKSGSVRNSSKMNKAAVELAKRGMGAFFVFAPPTMVNALVALVKNHIGVASNTASLAVRASTRNGMPLRSGRNNADLSAMKLANPNPNTRGMTVSVR